MQLPRSLTFQGVYQSTHCLKLKENLHGSKQAGRVCNQHLVHGLVNTLHFKQSTVDECVFYRGTMVLLVYMDDAILCGPSKSDAQDILNKLGTLFDITDEGEIDDYLGVKISRPDADTIVITQPHLIQQILDDLAMKPKTKKTKEKAAPSSTILRVTSMECRLMKIGAIVPLWASLPFLRNLLALKLPTRCINALAFQATPKSCMLMLSSISVDIDLACQLFQNI
jgi:hypothetical protein